MKADTVTNSVQETTTWTLPVLPVKNTVAVEPP